jgi:anti-sigma factor RsiW
MKTMTCAAGVGYLMDYLEGVLPAELRSTIDSHVAQCARCTAFVASYLETPRILRESTTTVLPESLRASLRAFLRAQRGGHE